MSWTWIFRLAGLGPMIVLWFVDPMVGVGYGFGFLVADLLSHFYMRERAKEINGVVAEMRSILRGKP